MSFYFLLSVTVVPTHDELAGSVIVLINHREMEAAVILLTTHHRMEESVIMPTTHHKMEEFVLRMSQTLQVPSSLPVAIKPPHGDQSTPMTETFSEEAKSKSKAKQQR